MIKKTVLFITALLFFPVFSCISGEKKQPINEPVRLLENYTYDHKSPLDSRIKTAPEIIISYWQKLDSRKDYSAYTPAKNEIELIKKYISLLPPLNRKIMKTSLVGIYFMNNFISSGATDWLTDKKGNIHTYMVFNPLTLKKSITELVTSKENTCFKRDTDDIRVEINLGKKYKGFLYILLHESVHVVDYVRSVTPYTEEAVIRFQKGKKESTAFTRGIWEKYGKSNFAGSFTGRVSFYGLGGEPKILLSSTPAIYTELLKSPFISLYASMNWAEDLAEILTFYHLTQKMGLPYSINISGKGKRIFSVRPAQNPEVKKRFRHLEIFYR